MYLVHKNPTQKNCELFGTGFNQEKPVKHKPKVTAVLTRTRSSCYCCESRLYCIRYTADLQCRRLAGRAMGSLLTTAIPDVEILVVRYVVHLFATWYNTYGSRATEFHGSESV